MRRFIKSLPAPFWRFSHKATGPVEYDLTAVEQLLYDGQKNGGRVVGTHIYDCLKRTGKIKLCLGLADALAIQAKGIKVFKSYSGKVVFFWRSVVLGRGGRLYVPYLIESGDAVELGWNWLGHGWGGDGPALRLAKLN